MKNTSSFRLVVHIDSAKAMIEDGSPIANVWKEDLSGARGKESDVKVDSWGWSGVARLADYKSLLSDPV